MIPTLIKNSGRATVRLMLCAAMLHAFVGCAAANAQAPADRRAAPAEAQGVTVEKIDYHGWKEAWRIRNSACELVVVPQVNRAMYFGLTGGENALWNNGPLAGQVVNADDHQWHNFGGDKVWPTQQDWWERYSDRKGWPPFYTFDVAPASVEPIPGGVRTTTQKSPEFGTRTTREFVLDPSRAMVSVHQWFAKEDGKPVTMSVWNVMQVRKPDYAMEPGGKVVEGQPYKNLGDRIVPNHLQVHPTVVTITNDTQSPMKIGAILDPAGKQDDWLAAVHGQQMILESRRLQTGGNYPDGGCPAQIYTAPARDGSYVEIELLSPLKELKPGDTLRDDMVWQLLPLTSEQVHFPDKAADLARAAHAEALRAIKRESPTGN